MVYFFYESFERCAFVISSSFRIFFSLPMYKCIISSVQALTLLACWLLLGLKRDFFKAVYFSWNVLLFSSVHSVRDRSCTYELLSQFTDIYFVTGFSVLPIMIFFLPIWLCVYTSTYIFLTYLCILRMLLFLNCMY